MTTTATLAYSTYLGGASAADLIALMDAVEPPEDFLNVIGVKTTSDSSAGANPVVDTVVLSLVPTSAATATCTRIDKGDSGSGIESVTVTSVGSGYVAPPVVTFTGGRPIPAPDPGYQVEPIVEDVLSGSKNQPAYAQAYLKLISVAIVSGGASYSADTFAEVTGFQKEGGTIAAVTLTIGGGVVTGVAVALDGSGYTGPAIITVVDPTGAGSGAEISVSMCVGEIDVLRSGSGYSVEPTVVLTPLFQALFPVGSDQAQPFEQLMTTALGQATIGPVSAALPVIA